MNGNPPAREGLDHLRLERRSYIIGTLVVWAVIFITELILFASMKPALFHQKTGNLHEAMVNAEKVSALNPQQQLLLGVVQLVGAVALFLLNWRFSAEMRRPRGAFVPRNPELPTAPGNYPSWRWLWWSVLALNSYFFFPQLILTPLMASWGKDELQRRAAQQQRDADAQSG